MINRFSQFLVEEESVVYFTFGRMNPPTIGHGKLLDVLASKARRAPYRIFLSQSNDKKDNPLNYKDKVKHVRKMFPKHARSIILNNKIKNTFDALSFLYDQGYRKVVMVAGSDRVTEYDLRLNKYNGKKGDHGFFNFDGGIKIISAGERDPDAKGAEGASGTKQRKYASENDFTKFAQGLPTSMSNANAKRLFNDVRKGLGLSEERQFKNHIQLEPVSDLREAYLRDNIFKEGEQVVLKKNGIVGSIKHLGTNYLIIESKGETWRCWLDDVDKVDPNYKIQYDVHNFPNEDEDGVVRESLNEAVWKKHGNDGEIRTVHKGEHWRVRKNYDHNDRHTGEYRIEVRKKNPYSGHDWEWHDTVRGKSTAKSRLPEGMSMYADKPDWGTPESTAKAKKMTPGQTANKESTQDPDIKDRPGTQPARYHKGLDRATKIARDRHFKKHGKKADNDSSAYKPAPGDATAKTKPSKYTKFVNRMMK